jgi:serine/threonine protein kinase
MIAKLCHPSIVNVIEFGIEAHGGEPLMWMALELIEGQTLAYILKVREGRRYSPTEAMALMRPVLHALAYAHDMGVVHRDLKPGNIMVSLGRHENVVKLIDFGIAKSMDESDASSLPSDTTHTRSAYAVYSPRYAAPEQVGRSRTGPWTDVHAVALTLTELLVGHPAYETASNEDIVLASAALSPVRPTPGFFGFDVGGWEPVLARAMALRAADRYSNASEFLNALEEGLVNSVEAVGPPTGATTSAWPDRSQRINAVQTEQPVAPPVNTAPETLDAQESYTDATRTTGKRLSNPSMAIAAAAALVLFTIMMLSLRHWRDSRVTATTHGDLPHAVIQKLHPPVPAPEPSAPPLPADQLPAPAPPQEIQVARSTATETAGHPTPVPMRAATQSIGTAASLRGRRDGHVEPAIRAAQPSRTNDVHID